MKENKWDIGELDAGYVAVGGPWQQMRLGGRGRGGNKKPKLSLSLSVVFLTKWRFR